MRKLIALLLTVSALLCLAACEKDQPTTVSKDPSIPTTQVRPTDKPTEPATVSTIAPTTTPTTVPTEPAHICTPGTWDMDLNDHWSTCSECGEPIKSAHTLDSENFCTDCGAEVWIYDGEFSSVYLCDGYGNCVLEKYYDGSGALLYSNAWEYTYDGSGNILSMLEYSDGVLTCEVIYDPETGNARVVNSYYDDGYWEYTEYDDYGSMTRWISYGPDDTVEYDYSYSYTYSEDGTVMYQKTYESGVLTSETEYAIFQEVDGFYTYPAKEILYYGDGSYTITEYNENYQVLAENYYDADGNLIDSSGKFDPEACAPLLGTWQGVYVMDGSLMGSSLDIRFDVTMTFDEQGMLYTCMTANMEDMKLATMDMIYTMYASYGYSQEDTDTLFQSEMGMTVEEYVIASLENTDVMDTTQMSWEVYYVEDGLLYSGASWTSRMEPSEFTLSGDTLTFVAEDGTQMVLTLTKAAE